MVHFSIGGRVGSSTGRVGSSIGRLPRFALDAQNQCLAMCFSLFFRVFSEPKKCHFSLILEGAKGTRMLILGGQN